MGLLPNMDYIILGIVNLNLFTFISISFHTTIASAHSTMLNMYFHMPKVYCKNETK